MILGIVLWKNKLQSSIKLFLINGRIIQSGSTLGALVKPLVITLANFENDKSLENQFLRQINGSEVPPKIKDI